MKAQSGFLAWLRSSGWALLLIALVQFILHVWANAHDNIFRDEMYYLAAGQHIDFGYVEFPPLVALVAAFTRLTLGTSVLAIRLLPALAGVATILLTGDMVALLGGGIAAQALAAVVIALGRGFLAASGLLTMDAFDQLWWTLAAWVVVRMIRDQQPKLWLLFGAVAGIGLLTKMTMAFFVIALLVGLLLSESRKLLLNRWLIFGGLIALVLVLPYLLWQIPNGFPLLEYTKQYSTGKTFQATPLQYFIQQLITLNPLALPLWLGGLCFLFFVPAGRPYRAFGWAYLFLYVFFMLQKAKWYWLSPGYPALAAAAAYGLQLLIERRPRLTWMQPAYLGLLSVTGLLMVPFAIPILPPETYIRFNSIAGGVGNVREESRRAADLPQLFADRYGWQEMVGAVKEAYDSLSPEEQAQACVLAQNYGEAGAVDYYGPALGLPRAISGHNSYFLWGPQGCTGQVLITIDYSRDDLVSSFESVKNGPAWSCKYCMPDENGVLLYIARGLNYPMEEAWPTVKKLD